MFRQQLLTPSHRRYGWAVVGLWLIALLAIAVRVYLHPQRQSVFSADYLSAGWHWLHGEEVYTLHRHFVYSPLVAAAFAPFSVLSESWSGLLWRLGCVGALLYVAAAWFRSGLSGLGPAPAPSADSTAAATAFLLLLPLTVGNVNMGQMNVLVLAATTGSVLAASRRQWNLAALLLAAGGFLKIYPLAIGLLLALLYPRQLSWRLLLALLALFLVSLILQSPAYAWTEYHHWFGTLAGDDRLDVDLYSTWRDFGYLLRACGVPLSDRGYRVMEAAAGGALALFLWLGQQRWAWSERRLFGAVFSLGCAWMVLFGPATEAATYLVLALPVCAALVASWPVGPVGSGAEPVSAASPRLIFAAAYALLLLSDLTNAWFHSSTHHLYSRALQPVAGLLFTAGVIRCLLQPAVPAEDGSRDL